MSNVSFGIGVYDERKEKHTKISSLIREYLDLSDLHGLTTILCTKEDIIKKTKEICILIIVLYENHSSGINLKNKLQRENINIPVVFVGDKKTDLISAFGKNVYAFFQYPIERDKLFLILDDILYEQRNYIMVNVGGSKIRKMIPSSQILYIVVEDVYTRVYTEKNHSLVRRSLREWEDLLGAYGFFRIGKSVLIQLSYVEKYNLDGRVFMKNGIEFVVGRRRKNKLIDRLRQNLTVSNI